MSGGSYNYLCYAVDAGKILERTQDMEHMANRLERSGYFAAARATRNVMMLCRAVEESAYAMTDVWKAVEWVDSDDWSEEQIVRAVSLMKPYPPEPPSSSEEKKP